MSFYYFDTSAIVKHYHAEVGTDRVEAIFNEPHAQCVISRLTAAELLAAFGAKVRAGTLTADVFHSIVRGFRREVDIGLLEIAAITSDDFEAAEGLLEKHVLHRRLRGADALHLAVVTRIRRVVTHFVCSDRDLSEVARREGFLVIDPEQP
jgi:predicted nucleic acid-binding protein